MEGQEKPDLYVIVGPNGSGKSTIIENSGIADRCPIIINPDNFVKKFPDIKDMEQRYIAAMEYCREQREILLEQGVTFGFETVGTHEENLILSGELKPRDTQSMLCSWTAAVPRKA